jgi:phage replication O-like protein O
MKLVPPRDEQPYIFTADYGSVENFFIDVLCRVTLPVNVTRVLMAILRQSWMFKHRSVGLTYEDIYDLTGLPRNRIAEAIKFLAEKKICHVTRPHGLKEATIFTINRDYRSWLVEREMSDELRGIEKTLFG